MNSDRPNLIGFQEGMPPERFKAESLRVKELMGTHPDPAYLKEVYSYQGDSRKLLDEVGPIATLALYLKDEGLIPAEAIVKWIDSNGDFDGTIQYDQTTLKLEICKPLLGRRRLYQGLRVLRRKFIPVLRFNHQRWIPGLVGVIERSIAKKAARKYSTEDGEASILVFYIALEAFDPSSMLEAPSFGGMTLENFLRTHSFGSDKVMFIVSNWDGSIQKFISIK